VLNSSKKSLMTAWIRSAAWRILASS